MITRPAISGEAVLAAASEAERAFFEHLLASARSYLDFHKLDITEPKNVSHDTYAGRVEDFIGYMVNGTAPEFGDPANGRPGSLREAYSRDFILRDRATDPNRHWSDTLDFEVIGEVR